MGKSTETENQTAPAKPNESSGRPVLLATFPVSRALEIPLKGEAFGRDWLEERGVTDRKTSREHCTFSRSGGRLLVEDLGSKNGTWVDGQRVLRGAPSELREGSVLRTAKTLLVYRQHFLGLDNGAPALGELEGPFGLQRVAQDLETLEREQPANVLIEGDTGTGKELLAAEVARRLGRALEPINMTTIASSVFESHLFGHVRGSFTGSVASAKGVLLESNGKAVLFDEIGELSLELQPKLLRVIQNREVHAIGAARPVRVDLIIIAATNRVLGEMADRGTFRRDLLTRLEQCVLRLPPLNDRVEDIFAICQAVQARKKRPLDVQKTEPEALEKLMLTEWEGNVRELSNVLDKAIRRDDPGALRLHAVEAALGPKRRASIPVTLTNDLVAQAMQRTGGNQTEAADVLGVSRASLVRFLSKSRKRQAG